MTKLPAGSPGSRSSAPAINPFARALQEAGGAQADSIPEGNDFERLLQNNPGLASQFGQNLPTDANQSYDPSQFSQDSISPEQQAETLKKQQLEQERLRLHRMINPVEQHDVFVAREQQTKRKIDEIRHELKLLMVEIKEANKEIELTVEAEIVRPGIEGTYYLSFLDRLKAFIILLRQQVQSARSWATQVGAKSSKAKRGPGLVGSKGHHKTKAVWDTMHHERSSGAQGAG
jgi:hypothetical protein